MDTIVFKYPLEVKDVQTVLMPTDAKILSVQIHPIDGICMWAEVQPNADTAIRRIGLLGTGMPIPDTLIWKHRKYIGTVQLNAFVWHLYDLGEA